MELDWGFWTNMLWMLLSLRTTALIYHVTPLTWLQASIWTHFRQPIHCPQYHLLKMTFGCVSCLEDNGNGCLLSKVQAPGSGSFPLFQLHLQPLVISITWFSVCNIPLVSILGPHACCLPSALMFSHPSLPALYYRLSQDHASSKKPSMTMLLSLVPLPLPRHCSFQSCLSLFSSLCPYCHLPLCFLLPPPRM